MNKNNLLLALVSTFMMFSIMSKSAIADDILNNEKLKGLGINTAEVKSQTNVGFGMTSFYSLFVELHPRYAVLTNDMLYVVTSDNRGVELMLPISRIESAGIIHTGLVGHLRDIHLKTNLAIIVFSFGIGESKLAEKFFSELTASGVKVSNDIVERGASVESHFIRIVGPAKD